MSKPSWAAIVKKPVLAVTEKVITQPLENDQILPTEVVVPEPPPPKVTDDQVTLNNSIYNSSTLTIPNTYELEIRQIQRRKEIVENDIQQKEDKFHSSYAYTRFNQDMEALNQQKRALEEKEAEIKRAIILSTGSYSKRVLDVIGRIKRYLGSEAEYTSRYTSRCGTIPMFCKITYSSLQSMRGYCPENLDDNMMALTWKIQEEIPNHIHIDFTTYSQDMTSILEAAIKSELKGFVVYKN